MKRTIEILLRLVAPPARFVALLLAVTAAGGAWATAPTATVVWESDFGTATKTGTDGNSYTITLNGNSVNSDGNLVINNSNNSNLGATIDISSSPTKASILIRYSSLVTKTTSRTLATFMSNGYTFGAQTIGNNTREMRIYENSTTSGRYWTPNTKPTLADGSGYLLMTYDRSVGTYAYTGSSSSTLSGDGSTSVKYTQATVSQVSVGGPCAVLSGTYAYAWDGVVIEKVAIFVGSTPTTSEIAEYVFPGDEALKSAVSEALDAGLDVAAWREDSASTFHTSKTGTVNSDGSVSPSAALTYGNYGRTSAIGPVLVYDKAGYVASSDAQFYPFAVGGLYVNALGASDATYTVTGSGDRPTRLGYTGYDTYFTFNQPFAFNREGNVTIYGAATVTTASGVTFDCNSAQTSYTTILSSGATLKLSGEGAMSVTTLNAANGTLDFSALSSRTAALPYITGTVQLGANTGIVLPAGTTSPYTIGTAVTGTFPSEITIGDETYKATVTSGENAGEIAWTINSYDIDSEETLTLEDMFTSTSATGGYEINVNESATLNIASATTIGSLTINVASGKTLTITGSALTVSNGITVSGSSGFVKMTTSLLLGTFVGDSTIIYSGVVPTSSSRNADFTSTDWEGIVWVENITSSTALRISDWVSANSKVKLTNVLGYLPGYNGSWQLGYDGSTLGELVIENTDSSGTTRSYGFCKYDGWSKSNYDSYCKFSKLSGSGTLTETSGRVQTPCFIFEDGSEFTGVIEATQGMGIVFGTSSSSFASKRIAIDANEEVTIPAGSTWSASSGFYVSGTLNANGTSASAITVNDGGVLNVASTASLTGAISGAGTVVGNQCFPVPGSSFTGTLTVNGAGIASGGTITSATDIYGSVLNVADGVVILSGEVATLPTTVNIASGATLYFYNSPVTSVSMAIGTWEGVLGFQECASLTSLSIDAGSKRSFNTDTDLTITLCSNLTTVNLTFDEVKGEGGAITLTDVTALPNSRTYNFTVNRVDGTTVTGTYDSATSTITYTPSISGAATAFDATFTNTTALAYKMSNASIGTDTTSLPAANWYTASGSGKNVGLYLQPTPYLVSSGSNVLSDLPNIQGAMSFAVVGQMPTAANTIFIHMGSSSGSGNGLILATTSETDKIFVGYNTNGKTIKEITTMTVPNSTTARHVYIITKKDEGGITTFTVYLDGIKWKTVSLETLLTFSSGGVQVGADFGGEITRNSATTGYYNVDRTSTSTEGAGYVNVMRLYDRIITPAEIAQYSDESEYPYVSPNGASSRTFATAAEDWVEATDTDWTNTDSSGTTTQGTAPSAGASVTVTAAEATEITVNLDSETSYEALTINGSAVTLASGGSGDIKVTGMTVIGAPVTVEYGAADFSGGPMTITEDGTITFDYSNYDISAIYTTTDIPLTSDVDEDSTKVFLTAPSASYRSVSLVYTSGHYAMRVAPNHENGADVYFKSGYLASDMNGTGCGTVYVDSSFTTQTMMFPGDTMVINDNSTLSSGKVWIKDDFVGNIRISRTSAMSLLNGGDASGAILDGVTITVDSVSTLNISKNDEAALNIGAATINGDGSVNIPSVTAISGAVSGTAALTISGTVNVASGGSIANAVAGTGTIAYAAIPAATPSSFTGWTGTVSLPSFNASSGVNFNNYGTTGSTIVLAGMTGGYILEAGKTVEPTLRLDGAMNITAMSSWTYTFAKIIGSGNLSFSTSENSPTINITSVDAVTTSDDYYSGTISNTTANNVTIGTLTLASGTSTALGTKLYTTGGGVEATSVVIGEETFTNTLGKNDGIYLPAAISVSNVTFDYYATYTNANVTATVADADAMYTISVNGGTPIAGTVDGTTVTFENVGGYEFGDSISYTITASGTSEGTTESASETVAKTAVSGDWMAWSDGGSNVGSWTTNGVANVSELPYSDSVVAFSGTNIYTAAWTSTGEVVTVTTSVAFGSPADSALTVDADAQAAIRIGTENDANVFQVYAGPTPSWVSVYNDTLGTPADDVTYALTLTLNYASQTFGVSVNDAGALTNAAGTASFPLAKNASTMQKVSYLGAGTFTSLAGSYVSAGYSADVGTEGNATNVVVAQSFVSDYLSSVSASEISTYLNPNATSGVAIAKNGLNYFANYALGLDPTKEEDKPIVDVTTDAEGKFVFKVKHPVYNAQGEITGYVEIDAADNVSTTVTLKYGTGANTQSWESAEGTSFAPNALPFGENNNVLYYKAEVKIGAK